MDTFDFLKSLDEKHNKKGLNYDTLYSAQDMNKILDSQKAATAKAENPELSSLILAEENKRSFEPKSVVASSSLKLEEIVVGSEKEIDEKGQDGDER